MGSVWWGGAVPGNTLLFHLQAFAHTHQALGTPSFPITLSLWKGFPFFKYISDISFLKCCLPTFSSWDPDNVWICTHVKWMNAFMPTSSLFSLLSFQEHLMQSEQRILFPSTNIYWALGRTLITCRGRLPALEQLFSALGEKRLGWHPWWDHCLGFMLRGENYFLPRAEAERFPDFSCPPSGPDPHNPEGWGEGGRWALGWSGQSQKELICWELHNRIGFWKHVRASSLHPGVKGQCKAAIGIVYVHWSSCE